MHLIMLLVVTCFNLPSNVISYDAELIIEFCCVCSMCQHY